MNTIRRNAQFSIEYLMITGIAILVLIPMVYVFYNYSQGTTGGIALSRINNIGNSIINSAESVYYLGEPTMITIRETFPEGIKNITVINDITGGISELVFLMEDSSEIPFSSNVPLDMDSHERVASQGLKYISIEAKGTYVNITIT